MLHNSLNFSVIKCYALTLQVPLIPSSYRPFNVGLDFNSITPSAMNAVMIRLELMNTLKKKCNLEPFLSRI